MPRVDYTLIHIIMLYFTDACTQIHFVGIRIPPKFYRPYYTLKYHLSICRPFNFRDAFVRTIHNELLRTPRVIIVDTWFDQKLKARLIISRLYRFVDIISFIVVVVWLAYKLPLTYIRIYMNTSIIFKWIFFHGLFYVLLDYFCSVLVWCVLLQRS